MQGKNFSLLISSLSGGGAERVTCNLANYLVSKNNKVTVLTMSDVEDTYKLDNRVKKITLIKKSERKNKLYNILLKFKRLSNYMSTANCDAYIVMLPITTIMMLMLRKKTKAKIIVSERVDPNSYGKLKQIILKKLSKRADGYVFQTIEAQEWYNLKDKKTIVIPNAINEDFLHIDNTSVQKKNKIVSVGRLTEQKNFKMLINAFSEVSKEFSNYSLIIYGEGKQREKLKKLITKLKINDKVNLSGYSKDIKKDIIDASLFVMTSNYEGMPNALIEAMALGLPCISTDCPCGGPRYLIDNTKNGILIPVKDEKELVKQMKFILSNEKIAKEIGDNAKKIVLKLNPDKIYGMWESYIKSIIK